MSSEQKRTKIEKKENSCSRAPEDWGGVPITMQILRNLNLMHRMSYCLKGILKLGPGTGVKIFSGHLSDWFSTPLLFLIVVLIYSIILLFFTFAPLIKRASKNLSEKEANHPELRELFSYVWAKKPWAPLNSFPLSSNHTIQVEQHPLPSLSLVLMFQMAVQGRRGWGKWTFKMCSLVAISSKEIELNIEHLHSFLILIKERDGIGEGEQLSTRSSTFQPSCFHNF